MLNVYYTFVSFLKNSGFIFLLLSSNSSCVVATVFSYIAPLSPKLLNLNNFVYFSVYRIRSLAVYFTLTYPFDVYWVMQMNNTSFFYAYNYGIIYFKYSLNLFSYGRFTLANGISTSGREHFIFFTCISSQLSCSGWHLASESTHAIHAELATTHNCSMHRNMT